MASYTVRPFLKGSPGALTYHALAAKMSAFGGRDVIRADNGTWYKMMPGEYDVVSDLSADQVRERTMAAIIAVHPAGGSALVTEAVRRCWSGLEVVPAPASAGVASLLGHGLRRP